ncbi:MAG: hypothetical protein LBQ83_03985 [Candidatus Margulisbacteria bacterium]|jgi:hypothetical protein|nr:hypothetical protein [Candidatus Margulisiibacteriota bacterium]
MSNLIDNNLKNKKSELLEYYRHRAEELIIESKQTFSDSEYKDRAIAINKGLTETRENLLKIILQEARKNKWDDKTLLESILLTTYTNYVSMIEARNRIWEYEYMSFSRRIGELWEPFCQLCWQYPLANDITFFVPPLFSDVKRELTNEVNQFIKSLHISQEQKDELESYYKKVWSLVTSGEVKLELDLHFFKGNSRFVADFKSGFSSNEKGNANRLLLVASVYKILKEQYNCLIFVRSEEEKNNHYLQTLKSSGLWEVYCSQETYQKIYDFTGFNLSKWLAQNVNWNDDFTKKISKHIKENNLEQYLIW